MWRLDVFGRLRLPFVRLLHALNNLSGFFGAVSNLHLRTATVADLLVLYRHAAQSGSVESNGSTLILIVGCNALSRPSARSFAGHLGETPCAAGSRRRLDSDLQAAGFLHREVSGRNQ